MALRGLRGGIVRLGRARFIEELDGRRRSGEVALVKQDREFRSCFQWRLDICI